MPGMRQIQDDRVRPFLGGLANSLGSLGCLLDEHPGFAKLLLQQIPIALFVIDNQDTRGSRAPLSAPVNLSSKARPFDGL